MATIVRCTCLLVVIPWAAAFPAALSRLSVEMDGSIRPPGDRLQITVVLERGEQPPILEIRAFIAPSQPGLPPRPIKTRSRTNRDRAGNYLARYSIPRPADGNGAGPIPLIPVVAYSDLSLPLGRHLIAYEVRGVVKQRAVFIRATEPSWVTVSQEPRHINSDSVADFVPSTEQHPVEGILVENGTAERQEFQLPIVVMRPIARTNRVDITIPGGFKREEVQGALRPYRWQPPTPEEIEVPETEEIRSLAGRPWVPLSEVQPDQSKRRVYYATNRTVLNRPVQSCEDFGDQRGEIAYGSVVVNIPVEVHERGNLELPSWWNKRDPKQYFLVQSVHTLSGDLMEELARRTMSERRQDVVVLVHGYNNTFEFAALRLAQLVYDIQFEGTPVLFSWPSEGRSGKAAYKRDEARAEGSDEDLAAVLTMLIDQRRQSPGSATGDGGKTGKIHLIAHSMGNRVALRALSRLGPFPDKPFGHVALVAADIDLADLLALYTDLNDKADSVTHYFCKEDKALALSQLVHLQGRVGQGPIFGLKGVENIDAAKANTSFFGHDYFVARNELLIDIQMLLSGKRPPQRETLRAAKSVPPPPPGYDYWYFP